MTTTETRPATAVQHSALDIATALEMPPPTQEQAAVIEAGARPLLVVAGAGSGKTETMAARVVWLVANGLVDPDQVLGLTFTRKAAAELSQRIAKRLRGLERAGIWTPPDDDGTGAEVLGGELPRTGLGEDAELRLDADAEGVLADQTAGIRVVGRDGRGAGRAPRAAAAPAR